MATSISFQSNTVLYVIPTRTIRPTIPFLRPTQFGNFPNRKPSICTSLTVARFGLGLGLGSMPPLPDPETTERIARELFGRAEGLFYTIADAAVTASASADSVASSKQSNDWLSGITSYMETVLKVLKNGLSTVHTPYSYGFAIILLTLLVKAATFPLSKKQVESAMAMRSFQPQIKAIQQRYAGDQERIQLETARLYKLAGINPLAGCLPTLATIPVWIGLYRALSNVANEGLLTEGFFWIPSLAGPTTIAARQSGGGISWLFPFVDGQPPLGWPDTLAYLVLPVLLVISQYVSVQIMQSTQPQSDDPSVKTSQAITKFLPLMIGYFSLSVPSGLSLYWLTNNILSTAQQVWLQKMGGANNPVKKLSNDSTDNREQTETLKSVFEVTPLAEPPKKEKPMAVGPQPGDRFRQLKELEARKKLQKEEEQRKTAAAASLDISKSVFEVTPVAEAPTKEKPTAVGPQPGDRFRQLKELEARKRQQREEEQRKTAAAANQDISKSVFEVTAVAEAPKIENPTVVGLQPGDRFRQLKELEARKRQQRDEEQRKTAAAAGQDISVTNGEVKKESNRDGSFLNGESPSAESTQDERQYLHENLKKEKAVSTIGATVNKVSMVDEHQR